jgi:hypothetical protein
MPTDPADQLAVRAEADHRRRRWVEACRRTPR